MCAHANSTSSLFFASSKQIGLRAARSLHRRSLHGRLRSPSPILARRACWYAPLVQESRHRCQRFAHAICSRYTWCTPEISCSCAAGRQHSPYATARGPCTHSPEHRQPAGLAKRMPAAHMALLCLAGPLGAVQPRGRLAHHSCRVTLDGGRLTRTGCSCTTLRAGMPFASARRAAVSRLCGSGLASGGPAALARRAGADIRHKGNTQHGATVYRQHQHPLHQTSAASGPPTPSTPIAPYIRSIPARQHHCNRSFPAHQQPCLHTCSQPPHMACELGGRARAVHRLHVVRVAHTHGVRAQVVCGRAAHGNDDERDEARAHDQRVAVDARAQRRAAVARRCARPRAASAGAARDLLQYWQHIQATRLPACCHKRSARASRAQHARWLHHGLAEPQGRCSKHRRCRSSGRYLAAHGPGAEHPAGKTTRGMCKRARARGARCCCRTGLPQHAA